MTKVLIKINDENEIIQISSSIFEKDLTDFIEIDRGVGDKFTHAQNLYLEKSIIDDFNRYNYKYINEMIQEVTHAEFTETDTINTDEVLRNLLGVE
ncbi:MAG: hypothetical protein R3Y12_02380 [Clostridia bacterium]